MSTLTRSGPRGLVPEILDWFDNPFAALRPQAQVVRFEEFTDNGRYVLRAELPGVDPDKDVEITVKDGVLTITGERREEERSEYRTEFRYGSFTRSITLPPGADHDDVKAAYENGILQVSVGLIEPEEPSTRHIAVETS